MTMLADVGAMLLRQIDPERAHRLAIRALKKLSPSRVRFVGPIPAAKMPRWSPRFLPVITRLWFRGFVARRVWRWPRCTSFPDTPGAKHEGAFASMTTRRIELDENVRGGDQPAADQKIYRCLLVGIVDRGPQRKQPRQE